MTEYTEAEIEAYNKAITFREELRKFLKKMRRYKYKQVLLEMRLELFETLGGARCARCGYDKDVRALHN
jgi:hypothetical protein